MSVCSLSDCCHYAESWPGSLSVTLAAAGTTPVRRIPNLPDGSPIYRETGILRHDEQADHIQCHYCGRLYSFLTGSSHLETHGITSDEYKEMCGLLSRTGLVKTTLRQVERENALQRGLGTQSDAPRVGGQPGVRSGPMRPQYRKKWSHTV